MQNLKYLVTIVVATHNRSKYAIPCLKSLLSIESDQLQIVMHDTSTDSKELKAYCDQCVDGRLIYRHCETRLSMTENHERALQLAEGKFVCLIGDDDTVSRRVVEIAEHAERCGWRMVTPGTKAAYYWPDFRTKIYGAAHSGRVYLSSYCCEVNEVDLHERLNLSLSRACQGTDLLPKLYHGLVSSDTLDKMRSAGKKIFYGTSPDISASVGLCLLAGTYHVIDFPFVLPGGSSGSNSGRSALKKHKGALDEDPHIVPFKNLEWPEVIPRFFSVETVWAQAAWAALQNPADATWKSKFNLPRLYAACLINHWGYRDSVWAARNAAENLKYPDVTRRDVLKEIRTIMAETVRLRFMRLKNPGPSNGSEVVAIVEDVYEARKVFDDRLDVITGSLINIRPSS